MHSPRVLSVGQCGFDHGKIAGQLRQSFGAEVQGADTHAEALDALRVGKFDLVLVNRVGDSDDASGLDLIRTLKADSALRSIAVMLVSGYPEAQAEAVGLGALPGFGKSELHTAGARDRLSAVLGGPERPGPS